MAEEARPDLILMAVNLGGEMDGIEAAEQIRARVDIPVVYLSWHAKKDVLDRAKKTELHGYLAKPVGLLELRSAIEVALYKDEADEPFTETEHRLHFITDILPAYIAYVGTDDLRYRFVNRRYTELFGIPTQEIIGKHIREVIGESNYQFALKYIEEVKTGNPASYETVFNTQRGKRWIKVNYVPDFNEIGADSAIIALGYDITNQKEAEEALRESEERFKTIAEAITEVFWMADVDTRTMLYVSPGYERVWGRPVASLYQNPKSFVDAIHEKDREQVIADLQVQKDLQPFDHGTA